jgi:hypothetical protein
MSNKSIKEKDKQRDSIGFENFLTKIISSIFNKNYEENKIESKKQEEDNNTIQFANLIELLSRFVSSKKKVSFEDNYYHDNDDDDDDDSDYVPDDDDDDDDDDENDQNIKIVGKLYNEDDATEKLLYKKIIINLNDLKKKTKDIFDENFHVHAQPKPVTE